MRPKMISFLYSLAVYLVLTAGCGQGSDTPADIPPPDDPSEKIKIEDCEQCLILAEQAQTQVAIADVKGKNLIWSWKPEESNVKTEHLGWFTNISDAKLVYDGKYLIACASGGGVALIRIADRKTLFYAWAGGNTHSVEILPDGNLVSASSTGNYLTVFNVDTLHFPENVYSKNIPIESGHNVVWDRTNKLLWSAAGNELKAFAYNFDCASPDLTPAETIPLPDNNAHDLFPVCGEQALWLTTASQVYKFDLATKTVSEAGIPLHENIKSASSGPAGFATAIIKPKTSWWTDEVVDVQGNSIYFQQGLKIYKARWLINNTFSYPSQDKIKICN